MTRTWAEAATYREATAAALAVARTQAPAASTLMAGAARVLFAGAGSSYYLAQAAAFTARSIAGLPAIAVPVSDLILRPDALLAAAPAARQPIVVISRSGSTSEAVAVAERLGAAGHPIVAVTCRAGSPLAALGSVVLAVPEGDERAIVMTRSFVSMLTTLLRVIATAGDAPRLAADLDALPEHWAETDRAVEVAWELAARGRWSRVVALGGGATEGLALEARLKITETSRMAVDAYTPFEFRHGPISVCEPSVLVVGLLLDDATDQEARVLDDVRALGASTWLVGGREAGRAGSAAAGEASSGLVSPIGTGLHPVARLPLVMPPLQALALGLAVARGEDPDQPRHLEQVVVLGALA